MTELGAGQQEIIKLRIIQTSKKRVDLISENKTLTIENIMIIEMLV